jgi:glycosyltransferase involved in cell wall biosynthesis
MRNILIIVQNLAVPFDRRVWQEAMTLRSAGFGVAVICPKSKMYPRGYERLEGVDIYRYPLLIEADDSAVGYFCEFLYCWFATLWLACRVYLKCPFDVIHACNPPDTYFGIALLFRPLGVKFVFDHHDLCPELYVAKGHEKGGVIYRLLLLLEWMTFRTADMVVATNDSYRDIAKTRGGVPDNKIVVVRSGPRRAWTQHSGPAPNLKQGREYLVVLLGQIGKQDGVDYLLRSIQVYRRHYGNDTFFVIIGEGPSQREMQRLACDLGVTDCAHFTGRICDDQLCAYLSTAEVCVDPDPWTEFTNISTMNKIIEYMSFGKPIVAFDLLEHRRSALEAARYVQPNHVSKFASGIRELLEDKQMQQRMSKFARERFQSVLAWELSEEHLIRAYESVFEGARLVDYRAMSTHDERCWLRSVDKSGTCGQARTHIQ